MQTVSLSYLDAIILGIVEGITEYLPISSTGHLTITEKLLGLPIDHPTITGYTATIQIGAIMATLVYFWKDIVRLFQAWVGGLRDAEARQHHDYTLAWAVIIGSLPVGFAGLLLSGFIEGPLRSLWVVAGALILWSFVMWYAEKRYDSTVAAGNQRGEDDITIRDGVILGLVQCFSLIPGVSRSGATISAGLLTGVNRVVATRLSFFLAIPALTAAGLYGMREVDTDIIGWGPMILGIVVSFFVAYAAIAWLLRFVASNSLRPFIYYRLVLGTILLIALGTGFMTHN